MREGKTDTVGRKLNCEEKPKVAFICVHNSCRSQIAEALGKKLASDVFESYSAGTETKPQINQDAVRIMKEIYGIDMEQNGQHSKLMSEIPEPDIAISLDEDAVTRYGINNLPHDKDAQLQKAIELLTTEAEEAQTEDAA